MRERDWTFKLARAWIMLTSLILDVKRRRDWRLEWEAELEHAWRGLYRNGRLNLFAKFRLLRRTVSSLRDVVLVRRLGIPQMNGDRSVRLAYWRVLIVDFAQDARLAIRSLRRTPTFTCTALLTIALGIGATTAVFSVVKAVLLSPLPHEDANQLVILWETDLRHTPPATVNVAPANFADWRSQASSFDGFAVYSIGRWTLTGLGEPEMVNRAWVSSEFLNLLRARPVLGRIFVRGDDNPRGNPVVVLSHRFWQTHFAESREVLGGMLTLNGIDFEIVGVLEPGVDFLGRGIQVWTPYRIDPIEFDNRSEHYLNVLARLHPGVSPERAQTEMDAIADRIRLEHPDWMTHAGVAVVPLRDQMVGNARRALQVLLGADLAVLLIAAVNAANLLLVRAIGRSRQFAVRSALGAGRQRLVRQSLTESLTLSITGGATGVALAAVSTNTLLALAPGNIRQFSTAGLDWQVLCLGMGLSVLVGLLSGLLPALQSGGSASAKALTAASRWSGVTTKSRVRQVLVVGELAVSAVLLIAAGLLTQTFWRLTSVEPGFASEGILVASFRLPQTEYPDAASANAFYDELLARVRDIPQARSAGMTRFLPLGDGPWTSYMTVEDQPPVPLAERQSYVFHPVSTDFFRTAGMTLRVGRDFSDADNADAVPVVIINESMKRRFWLGTDPIGARIRFDRDSAAGIWREIVGVVNDVRHDGPHREARPTLYAPQHQAYMYLVDRMRLVVATDTDPLLAAQDIRHIVYQIDPNLAVFDIRAMDQLVATSVAQPKFAMLTVLVFAGVAAVLALVGIYGLISYTVSQRMPELGLRIALGAQNTAVSSLMLSQGMTLVALGIGIGILGALALSRVLQSLLFEISATDPRTYVVLALGLAIASAGACFLPARKAASADPMEVMRGE